MTYTPRCSEEPARQAESPSGIGEQLAAQWASVRGRMHRDVGEVEYRSWLRHMTLVGLDGDEVTINLPTGFLRDYVRTHYADRLHELWQAENRGVRRVAIRLGASVTLASDKLASDHLAADKLGDQLACNPQGGEKPPATGRLGEASGVDQPALPAEARGSADEPRDLRDSVSSLDGRFSFENFVVGKPNEFAYACARRVAERPSSPGFNPLFLYGDVGLGKTHLMHAIGIELQRREGAHVSVQYMSAERFMYKFIAAIRNQSTMEFKGELRGLDVLMIDDLQFLIGKDNTQEEFFHTFNALVDAGKQIVVSADQSPSDMDGIENRLRTRLGWGMVADLHATTYELRLSILEAKAGNATVAVPPKVLELLAHKITGSIRELEGSLNRICAHFDLVGRPITLESTQDLLQDVLKKHDRRVGIEEIQRKVAEHWSIRLTDMTSARRARAVARPRQVAMYLSKQLTTRSLPEIGRMFGNRDHTTVMHAVQRVSELMAQDSEFKERVDLLRRLLEN